MPLKSLDIIVPCYNPLLNWEKELYKNFLLFSQLLEKVNITLILINDGSTKNVEENNLAFLRSKIANFKYVEYKKNKGKGFALRQGVAISTAEDMIFTDIDFPYKLNSIVAVFNKLQHNADVVLGHRNSSYYSKTPFIRTLISKSFRSLLKLSLSLKATDTQCGLKGFNQKGKEEFLKTTINRFLFDLEFVKRCSQRKDLIIKIEPVTLKENVVFSQMNFKILAGEGLNFLLILLKK